VEDQIPIVIGAVSSIAAIISTLILRIRSRQFERKYDAEREAR
jgi:hypothetical protein